MSGDTIAFENGSSMAVDSDRELEGMHTNALTDVLQQRERELRKAYELGLLHGMNAQSMAQVKNDVMEFEDYGWTMEETV